MTTDPTPTSLLSMEPRALDAVAAETVLDSRGALIHSTTPPFSTDHSAAAVLREAVGRMGNEARCAYVEAIYAQMSNSRIEPHGREFQGMNANPTAITVAAITAAMEARHAADQKQ